MSSAEVRYLKINFDEILVKLKEYANRKARTHKVKAIVLTGSLAKKTYTGTSDADILIIADDLPTDMLERCVLFAEPKMPLDVIPIVYTVNELLRRIRQRDRFALEALEIGIPLYGEDFLKDLQTSLSSLSQKRMRPVPSS